VQTSGSIVVNAPRDQVYAFVADPHRLATCIPGCSDLKDLGAGKYEAVLSNRVGFVTLKFNVVVQITRQVQNEEIDATITGNPMGLAGRLEAKAGIVLSDVSNGATEIRYSVDMGLTGKLGGIGQPVFRAKSEELSKQFGSNLQQALSAPATGSVR
jgi:carbon monoxide dehydrogenase subunit G